jgi:hypothetical protein
VSFTAHVMSLSANQLCRSERNTGFWDGVHKCILAWLNDHRCKTLCKKLGLKDMIIDVNINNNMAS